MNHAKASGRLSILAVGLGIGAALASTPGVASADSSTDPFSWIGGMDLGDLSAPAQTSALDMQVSIDGLDLFPTAGNTASAFSGLGSIAIAIGDGSFAGAGPDFGIFDFAFADGTNSNADADTGTFGDVAFADGANSGANAGGSILDIFDVASANGANSFASAGAGIFDAAFVNGTSSTADAGGIFGTFEPPTPGIFGSFDLAEVTGNMLHALATGGNFLTAILP